MIIIDLLTYGDKAISYLQYSKSKETKIFCFKEKINIYSQKKENIKVIPIDVIENSFHFKTVKNLHEQLYKWANEIKIENENIFDFLKYRDIPSVYWLLDNWQLFISILKFFRNTILIKKIIDNNYEKEMIIICSIEYENFVNDNYKNKKNISIYYPENKIKYNLKYYFELLKNIFFGFFIFIGFPIISFFRKTYFNLIKPDKISLKKKNYAIFSPSFHYQSNDKKKFYDKVMAPWQQYIEKIDGAYWYSDFIDFSGPNFRELKEKAKNEKNYLPLDYFFSWSVLFRYFKGSLENFKKIKKVLPMLKNMESIGYDIPPSIKIEIIKCNYTLPFIISYYEALFVKYIKYSDVRTIIMCSEAGIIGRIFNPIIQKHKKKLIGVQHGGLGWAIDYTYFHIKEHINNNDYTNSNLSSKFFTLPNKTIIWSKKIKSDLIKKGRYPAKSLLVIGNMQRRSNQIFNLNEIKELKKANSIPNDKKIILLAVRTGGKGLNEKFDFKCLDMVYDSIKKDRNLFLLTKLHPLEKPDLHNVMKKKFNIDSNQLKITKKLNIKTAILISDIIISVRSTTIFEVMEYKKPIIIINPENSDLDALEFSKTGAVFYATNQDEIKPILEHIFKNSLSKNMIKSQEKCVEDFLGENDADKEAVMQTAIFG